MGTRLVVNQKHTSAWVREQNKLDIAVAFWGEGAIKELGLDQPGRKFRVLLDLSAGASNPDEVRALWMLAPKNVKVVERLHAKAYVTSTQALVGSANASANGLGWEGKEATSWHELGMLTDDRAVVRDTQKWFDDQWTLAEPVSESKLKKAAAEWEPRQRLRPKPVTDTAFILEAAIADPAAYRNRGMYVVVSIKNLDKEGARQRAAKMEETGKYVYCWQDWPNIPKEAKLISFELMKGKDFEKDGPAVYYTGEGKMTGDLNIVTPATLDDGMKVDRITTWRPALRRAKEAMKTEWRRDNGLCMDLGKFAAKFGKKPA